MLQTIAGVSMLSGLSLLVIFVLALVAMQLFGGTYHFEQRYNFDSFGNAMLTMFAAVWGQMGTSCMLDVVRAHGFAGSMFFVLVLIIGRESCRLLSVIPSLRCDLPGWSSLMPWRVLPQ